jgi:hypothetical protein
MRQRCPATTTRVRNGTGWGCSSAGRPARRCGRCGGSAGDDARCRRRLRVAGRSRPTSRCGGRGCPHRRSVSARPVSAACWGVDRRGSARPRWGQTGWPTPRTHSPARGRAHWPAVWGQRRRPHRRPPTPPVPARPRRGQSTPWPVWVWSRNLACHLRDSGAITAHRVVGPAAGQIQAPVDQGVPTIGGIGQIHRDWRSRSVPRCRCTDVALRPCPSPS